MVQFLGAVSRRTSAEHQAVPFRGCCSTTIVAPRKINALTTENIKDGYKSETVTS